MSTNTNFTYNVLATSINDKFYLKEQAKQTGKFTKGSNKIVILTDIQYICKENKVSLCEQNIEVSNRKTEEAPERTQLTINYLLFAGTETDSS